MQVAARTDYVYSTWRILIFFFIHAKFKVNCGDEGTEWHSLGKLPLDFIQNQEDGEARQLEQM